MKVEPKTLKGFRDFLPIEARKRNYVLNILKDVFESYGFEPLETPTLEYEEILTGKYGDEGDKLTYKFTDNGGRKVAMRYDQTVPLARVVAQYQNDLPLPFKRYQIQNVFRAENTQKGRYREFLQVDVDTVGSSSFLADAEIIKLIIDSYEKLGFSTKGKSAPGGKNFKVLINDRSLFEGLDKKAISVIDKLEKIGMERVRDELKTSGYSPDLIEEIKNKKPTKSFDKCSQILKDDGIKEEMFMFQPTLARGLDYYTGLIFEVNVGNYSAGSLGGGGRYDNLIGMFSGRDIPAVGFSFGFDRIIEAMEDLSLFPKDLNGVKVLVTNTNNQSADVAKELRDKGVKTELYTDEKDLDKQLRYADKKRIPYVLIIWQSKLELKDMKTGKQEEITLEELPSKLQ